MIRIFAGYDPREAIGYHVFCQSLIERSTDGVAVTPLFGKQRDGTNAFTYQRFLIPYFMGFQGRAIFLDGADMLMLGDIAELDKLYDPTKAVQVVKHDYQTKAQDKYLGNKNQNYPRKNWSSVVLWNCGHPDNRILTPEFVQQQTGAFLHRFTWLRDEQIGEIPREWNWLTTEYPDNYDAKLLHYTLGTPCFKDYWSAEMADEWHAHYARTQDGMHV